MNCSDLEILLCDYVDGSLHAEQKSAVEEHLSTCRACAEMAKDAAGAVAFMARVPVVEPPPELLTRIRFELPTTPQTPKSLWKRFKAKWIEPVLQPRFAMGMAMTVLSFAMLGRFAGIHVRQLKAADLDPVKIWRSLEDQAVRTWDRAVKYYESLRLVYEVQSRLKEWNDQGDDRSKTETGKGAGAANSKKAPNDTGGKR